MKSLTAPVIDPEKIRTIVGVDGSRDESLILHCTKCDKNTSGIYSDSQNQFRRCPACKSLLMYCPVCQKPTSGTEKYNMLSCDQCHNDFVTDTTIAELISRDSKSREIVLSGIRATGRLHLGNFLGAVQQFIEYEKGDNLCMYFIADWHSLTTCHDPVKIKLNSQGIAMDYLAAGLNPERSIVYNQSSVPEIAELALYLSMLQSKRDLEGLPTVKDLVKDNATMSMGHLFYPVLMAADILGPKATLVPVGSDQVANVELATHIARKFNAELGTSFVIPRLSMNKIVPSLQGGKMGKSEATVNISLEDSLEIIRGKYQKHGVTDVKRVKKGDPGDPDVCVSVFPLYRILREKDPSSLKEIETGCRSGARGCFDCKMELATEIDKLISPFRERRRELSEKTSYVKEVLHYGGKKAREIIQPTLREVRELMGITEV